MGITPYRHRKKKIEMYGLVFDSPNELKRYEYLMQRYRAGEITQPEVHPEFVIIINGQKVGTWKADFRYYAFRAANIGKATDYPAIIEDCKPGYNKKKKSTRKGVVVREWKVRAPFVSEGWRFKKKVVEASCGITITEIWE